MKYNPMFHSSVVKKWDVFEDYFFDFRDDDIKYLEGLEEANQKLLGK